jgi:hypothetical protein
MLHAKAMGIAALNPSYGACFSFVGGKWETSRIATDLGHRGRRRCGSRRTRLIGSPLIAPG